MASRRAVRVASLGARWVRPWLIQAMGCDWRRIHADRDGIPVRELRIAQKSGWEADRSSITIKIITREATAIGRQKKGRMSYASWARDQLRLMGNDYLRGDRGASNLRVPVNALALRRLA
ncbi:hypothetical protein JQ629_30330 [Bradyrhizobium sp. AUGA SZCCT0222]|uniref:hypothetical protein n=1 Tax=Bradyrhizobium sp. AUGA SZCCT0222 TaxID=2807668 RepID=UPI001BA51221|nr:hypothetical protein [Bradyrhizobium sp. AUGA SZCCT0222]MBR1271790.1 hypothetical protein [Bradyrhizobium sp. AUGA SZCCT0222]